MTLISLLGRVFVTRAFSLLLENILIRDGSKIGLSSVRAEAPGASRRRGRRGGSGRSDPFRPQREEICVVSERPETRLRLLVDVPRRFRTRESWVFTFRTRSLPNAWDHGTALALPMDGRETPVRRRAACPGTGVAVPDGAGPRPRSTTRGTRPFVDGSERKIGIFSGHVKGRHRGDSALEPRWTPAHLLLPRAGDRMRGSSRKAGPDEGQTAKGRAATRSPIVTVQIKSDARTATPPEGRDR